MKKGVMGNVMARVVPMASGLVPRGMPRVRNFTNETKYKKAMDSFQTGINGSNKPTSIMNKETGAMQPIANKAATRVTRPVVRGGVRKLFPKG